MEKAVLIITGHGHVPEHYSRVTSLLQKKGIRTICECLPTINHPLPPFKTIYDDIRFIKDIVSNEVGKGTRLTVLCHSYGGMIASAALGEFAFTTDAADKGGVTSIVFMTAFIASENGSVAGLLGDETELPSALGRRPDGSCWVPDPVYFFYNDLSGEDAEWAAGLYVSGCPASSLLDRIPGERVAWRSIPSTYIVCEADCAIPLQLQRGMLASARDQGVKFDEYSIQSGHSPFINKPAEIAEIVINAMQRH
ncbi:hypothetical protein CP533_2828 [Ophiocordyceps camponoti-saundersi (nom. inval.)]|nr:hypothetical protein CP533_2828 [Ophiocordyceps camponoti-saundersi (nom. inval.)]